MCKKDYGLEQNAYRKNRRWAVDNVNKQDGYVEDLIKRTHSDDPRISKEAEVGLLWLQKFNNEYYDNHGLMKEDALHNTEELRKECYNATNAANRDIFSILNSGYFYGALLSLEYDNDQVSDLIDENLNTIEIEQLLMCLEAYGDV